MNLSYQPFADAAEIEKLRTDLGMNVPAQERLGSVFVGAGLLVALLSARRTGKVVTLLIGAALIWRGLSGRCPWYDRLGLDRRHGVS